MEPDAARRHLVAGRPELGAHKREAGGSQSHCKREGSDGAMDDRRGRGLGSAAPRGDHRREQQWQYRHRVGGAGCGPGLPRHHRLQEDCGGGEGEPAPDPDADMEEEEVSDE